MKNRKRELHDQLLTFIDENGPTTKRGIRLAFGTKSEAQINFILNDLVHYKQIQLNNDVFERVR